MNIIKIRQELEKEKAQLENLYELDYECWLQKNAEMDVDGDDDDDELDQMYAGTQIDCEQIPAN